jgi:hypothetical protein
MVLQAAKDVVRHDRCTCAVLYRTCVLLPLLRHNMNKGSQKELALLHRHVYGYIRIVCKVPCDSIHNPKGWPLQQKLLTIARANSAHSADSAIKSFKIASQPTPTCMPSTRLPVQYCFKRWLPPLPPTPPSLTGDAALAAPYISRGDSHLPKAPFLYKPAMDVSCCVRHVSADASSVLSCS